MNKLRLHLLGLPWTVTSKDFCDCAYTSKILKFAKMMTARGHEVTHYGAEGATVECPHVTVMTQAEQMAYFGPRDLNKPWGPPWDPNHHAWGMFNAMCAANISQRLQPGDFICHITGASRPLSWFFKERPDVVHVEYGIGYSGVFADYKAFESHSIRDAIWFHDNWEPDGRSKDWVIPNYFDVDDFPAGTGKGPTWTGATGGSAEVLGGDYLLFVGRIIRRKGLAVAMETAKRVGMKLIIAGQGATRQGGALVAQDGVIYRGGDWDYVGRIDAEQRAKLMGGARAILAPSYYTEPFGGVHVEAMLCGTPAITYDWGGFSDTIENGKNGYRCMTLADFITAAKIAHTLDRNYVRERAISRFSLEAVAPMFEQWFQMIRDDKTPTGWETEHPERTNLDWMR